MKKQKELMPVKQAIMFLYKNLVHPGAGGGCRNVML